MLTVGQSTAVREAHADGCEKRAGMSVARRWSVGRRRKRARCRAIRYHVLLDAKVGIERCALGCDAVVREDRKQCFAWPVARARHAAVVLTPCWRCVVGGSVVRGMSAPVHGARRAVGRAHRALRWWRRDTMAGRFGFNRCGPMTRAAVDRYERRQRCCLPEQPDRSDGTQPAANAVHLDQLYPSPSCRANSAACRGYSALSASVG
jgi:hypothetical protein